MVAPDVHGLGFELGSPVRVLPHGGAGGDTGPAARPEIPVEQMSGGVLARMRPDLGTGAALGPRAAPPG